MVNIILVRHGYSVSNKARTCVGQSDVPLCEEGFTQAQLVADYLASNFKIDAIYSSDLIRAVDTSVPIAKKLCLPIVKDKALREFNAGKWENVPLDEIKRDYTLEYDAWLNDMAFTHCPDGENLIEVHNRSLNYIKKICEENDGKTLAIFTHGGVLLPFQCYVQGIDNKNMGTVPWVPNASISLYTYENGKFTDQIIGFTEHLKGLVTVLEL